MTSTADRDQKHPQEKNDRQIVENLLQTGINDFNLVELARLQIRYRNFPGAREMQRDLDLLIKQWGLTEEELYDRTRELHSKAKIYQNRGGGKEQEDWS